MRHKRLVISLAILLTAGIGLSSCASRDESDASAPAAIAPDSSPSGEPTVSAIDTPAPLKDVSIALEPWAEGFTRPTLVTSRPGDDRVYVVEQDGRVVSLPVDGSERTTVLDIRSLVNNKSNERGLLGIAFYPENPSRMFVSYSDKYGNSRIAEYSFPLDAAEANPDQVQALLKVTQPYSNHNGGMIAFGPDSYLYIGLGDGGSAGDPQRNGQNPKTKLGAILRIDVSGATGYTIPATNPFQDGKRGAKTVWAYGVRNPWRFSFDGDQLYIADVGQGRAEEIDIVNASTAAGSNFGWRTMEGNRCYPSGAKCSSKSRGFVAPAFVYSHSKNGRCSVTGGYVYRGEEYPQFDGIYFFGDFCSGEIVGLRVTDGKVVDHAVLLDTSARISSFGVGPDGQLYVADLSKGAVRRVVPGS
jgi:glucose/arabinose dehydrogenase